ncbi:MAG: M20/M25/M40 family metallo-hydrolase [Acidobacteria bacterium]|nr:M20/M25/M40 family metallo-hydrolase [Acidobacteriota bacterium]
MKSASLPALAAFALVPLVAFGAGSLNAIEQRIVAEVDRNNTHALALLERAVNTNSGTMNLAGVRKVGDLFRAELDALGFQTTWIDGTPFKRAGHLVAEHRGEGPHLLLIGHLDTVFEQDSPFQRFERVWPDAARGPGMIDMKGGDVIIVYALRALAAAGALDRANISVIMTGDEEHVGEPRELARQSLKQMADAADIAIGFEDGSGDPRTAVIARRGVTGWELRVTGKPAHSSQIFREDIGAGAIFEAARILHGFYERLAGETLLTLNPGVILGGTTMDLDVPQSRGTAFGKSNVVAEHAIVTGDLRTISADQLESAKERMMSVAAAHLPHASADLTFRDGYPPLAPSGGNRRLLQLYDQASRDVGAGPVEATDPRLAGAADVSFTAGLVEMAIDGIGLMGTDDHTTKETADLATLPSQTKRAGVLLYRLTHRPAKP